MRIGYIGCSTAGTTPTLRFWTLSALWRSLQRKFLQCDAMHKRGYCRHAVSVRLSVTFVSCAKTNKDIFEIFSPSGSQAILVFPCQTGWRYSDGNLPNGASNAGGVGKKRDSERISLHTLHTGLQCCKPYESRSVKNIAATDGVEPSTHGGVRRSLFSQDDEVFVTGSTLYARDGGQPPPRHNPLVITPFSAAVGHRRPEPGGYFC